MLLLASCLCRHQHLTDPQQGERRGWRNGLPWRPLCLSNRTGQLCPSASVRKIHSNTASFSFETASDVVVLHRLVRESNGSEGRRGAFGSASGRFFFFFFFSPFAVNQQLLSVPFAPIPVDFLQTHDCPVSRYTVQDFPLFVITQLYTTELARRFVHLQNTRLRRSRCGGVRFFSQQFLIACDRKHTNKTMNRNKCASANVRLMDETVGTISSQPPPPHTVHSVSSLRYSQNTVDGSFGKFDLWTSDVDSTSACGRQVTGQTPR